MRSNCHKQPYFHIAATHPKMKNKASIYTAIELIKLMNTNKILLMNNYIEC